MIDEDFDDLDRDVLEELLRYDELTRYLELTQAELSN